MRPNSSSSEALHKKRESLAIQANNAIERFSRWRGWARNSLWASLVLLLMTIVIEPKFSVAVRAVLVFGTVVVPITVVKFRREFWPVLTAYKAQQARGVASRGGKPESRGKKNL